MFRHFGKVRLEHVVYVKAIFLTYIFFWNVNS